MEGVWGGVSVRGDSSRSNRTVITSRVLKSATHSSEAEVTVSLGCTQEGSKGPALCLVHFRLWYVTTRTEAA